MSWKGTIRYGIDSAPGGLGFVQDLLNTQSAGKPRSTDLLDEADDAQAWLDAGLAEWSRTAGKTPIAVELGPRDLKELRRFRTDLKLALGTGNNDPADNPDTPAHLLRAATTQLRLGPDGRVSAEPRGAGARQIESLMLVEIFEAQLTDIWRRLKTCRNDRCQAAFFDRSRNNSGVWHDVRVCGHAENLRAHRARKRAEHQV
ncbi:CGNR zinc finger domain-containing protein [Arthrobacter ramosus]|uniref:CGNR zinc finger domain-containing protein n=1 Tax=Arthrobacter ramosus TaxID=1672 RepID=A0ABV5Y4P0_ARTRM|nr:CGNR zinc finger domain-containing protein [Arthrobacter ramosus]